jgi:hypothetical protein
MTYDIGNPDPDMMQILSIFDQKSLKNISPVTTCTNQSKYK